MRQAIKMPHQNMKTVYIATNMEGISSIDTWEQCYETDSTDYAVAMVETMYRSAPGGKTGEIT
jgi:hypothetical protein